MRSVVDLPEPFGPRKPWTVPVATERSSPSRARAEPKVLTRPCTEMASSSMAPSLRSPAGVRPGSRADPHGSSGRRCVGILHDDGGESPGERKFCARCGSALWVWDPRWPELLHPHASAIDTPLPAPPERTHLMLASKAPWVEPCLGPRDKTFDEYPDESLAAWHQRLGLER